MPNKHHLVPTSRGGTSRPHNLAKLDERFHANFHAVFQNMTPAEQIRALLNLNAPALREEFRQRVHDALNRKQGWIYEDWIFRRN